MLFPPAYPAHSAYRPTCLPGLLMMVAAGASIGCTLRDSDREAAIAIQFAVDPATRPYELIVSVENGIARLDGQTATRAEQQRAVEIVSGVPGVRTVQSTLTLVDAAIEATLIETLGRDPILGRLEISVRVHRGVARLDSARTNPAERQRALEWHAASTVSPPLKTS